MSTAAVAVSVAAKAEQTVEIVAEKARKSTTLINVLKQLVPRDKSLVSLGA